MSGKREPQGVLEIPLAGTHLIEASAGTGKTFSIARLVLRLIVEQGIPIERILVVTFTEAATAELRDRIRRKLTEALDCQDGRPTDDELIKAFQGYQPAKKKNAAEALAAAVASFDQAAIMTIHGFCNRILHEHAFESGVLFDTELISDEGALLREVLQDFWAQAVYQADDPAWVQAISAEFSPSRLAKLAQAVAARPDRPIRPWPAEPEPDVSALLAESRAKGSDLVRFQQALAVYLRAELPRRKLARNVHSFDDLLHRFLAALKGGSGELLRRNVQARYQAALIDEFQDTDQVQYEIFQRLFKASKTPLFLIGDPKQSIYGFRGADIFAYFDAVGDAKSAMHALQRNFRSDESLVEAVNILFERIPAPFLYPEIGYARVQPRDDAADQLKIGGKGQPALVLQFLRRDGLTNPKTPLIEAAHGRRPLAGFVARDIVGLLRSQATIGARRVSAGDIAVLTRTNSQIDEVLLALQRVGVPAVLHSGKSVFDSAEAGDLGRVLKAVAAPGDTAALRAALATDLLGLDAGRILALESPGGEWERWILQVRDWHRTWAWHGFMRMWSDLLAFREVPDGPDVRTRILGLADGDRRLTNLRHLAELLHAAAQERHLGIEGLRRWYEQQWAGEGELAEEERQVRLETDDQAVRLVTIHKAKGLEYPIVYCPFLWTGKHAIQGKIVACHEEVDGRRESVLHIGTWKTDLEPHKVQFQVEDHAERMRMLYVALTRAQHQCRVVWGAFSGMESSALGYLLFADCEKSAPKLPKGLGELTKKIKTKTDAQMREALAAIAARAAGTIAVTDLELEGEPLEYIAPAGNQRELAAREVDRELERRVLTRSFSAIVPAGAPATPKEEEGRDRDVDAGSIAEPVADEPVFWKDLPGGKHVGNCIHDIFEEMDFGLADRGAFQDLVAERLASYGLDVQKYRDLVCQGIEQVLDAAIDPELPSLKLSAVKREQQCRELEFLFATAGKKPIRDLAHALADIFREHRTESIPAGYPDTLAGLEFPQLGSFMRGFMDLAFEHEGHWYLIDYKTNLLGGARRDYAREHLAADMASHHYFLQYHLYLVALHRFLRRRLENYSYEKHFGGVRYLFLRGMAPHGAPGYGVFRDLPTLGMVEALDRLLGGKGGDK